MKVAALLVVCVVLLATSTDAMSLAEKKDFMTAENMAKFQKMGSAFKAKAMAMYKAGDKDGLKAMKAEMDAA